MRCVNWCSADILGTFDYVNCSKASYPLIEMSLAESGDSLPRRCPSPLTEAVVPAKGVETI
jgi:hypothetical protein